MKIVTIIITTEIYDKQSLTVQHIASISNKRNDKTWYISYGNDNLDDLFILPWRKLVM